MGFSNLTIDGLVGVEAAFRRFCDGPPLLAPPENATRRRVYENSNSTNDVSGATAFRGLNRLGLSPRPFTGVSAAGGKGRERPCILRRVDAPAKRQSEISNLKSQISNLKSQILQSPIPNLRRSRGGFTLIEMLVTIGIMLMLVTAA